MALQKEQDESLPERYPRPALKYAIKMMHDGKFGFKAVCLEIGGKPYYSKVYNKQNGKGWVDKSDLEPIFRRLPEFKKYIDEGVSIYNQNTEQGLQGTIMQAEIELERLMLKIDGIRQDLRKSRLNSMNKGL